MSRKRVIVESPCSDGGDPALRATYDHYLDRAVADSIARGEAPFASHGFYTMYLDDKLIEQRAIGMACGFAWMAAADLVAVYMDYGSWPRMRAGITGAVELGIPVDHRHIGKNGEAK